MTPEQKKRWAAYMRGYRKDKPRTEVQRAAGRLAGARFRAAHPGRRTPYKPEVWKRRAYAYNMGPRQAYAKKKGIPWTLTKADIEAVWTEQCAITGLPFDKRKGVGKGPKPFSPSLDRIRPALGYVPGNVRFVLHCVNTFKGTMSDRLMARVAERIASRGTLSVLRKQADKA